MVNEYKHILNKAGYKMKSQGSEEKQWVGSFKGEIVSLKRKLASIQSQYRRGQS